MGDGNQVTIHPNEMTHWPEIACQRGHLSHEAMRIHVDLSVPHDYHDYAQVPPRLHRSWDMLVWDPCVLGDGPYCPANDTVSQTIQTVGIWEPRETILASQVFSTAEEGQGFLDMGAQLGWFSHLSRAWKVPVWAFDADSECVRVLRQQGIGADCVRFGIDEVDDLPLGSTRLAKLDLEGAEQHAIRCLWPAISDGRVDHILMEVSPCFNDSYPALVTSLIDVGYDVYLLPSKKIPPYPLDHIPVDMAPFRMSRAVAEDLIPSLHQEDMWFKRKDASW